MADIKMAYGTPVTGTGGITSLAQDSSGNFLAGYEWYIIDNGTDKAIDRLQFGKITVGTTPTINTEIRIYVVPSWDGTLWPDVFDGTPSAETATNVGVRDGSAVLARALRVPATTSSVGYPYQYSLAALFGGSVPKKAAVFVSHNTGVNLNSTAGNHTYNDQPIYATVG